MLIALAIGVVIDRQLAPLMWLVHRPLRGMPATNGAILASAIILVSFAIKAIL